VTALKKGDWVRLSSDRRAPPPYGDRPVPEGFIGKVVKVMPAVQVGAHADQVRVSLKRDAQGKVPDYKRTGAFCSTHPDNVHKLTDLEALVYGVEEWD